MTLNFVGVGSSNPKIVAQDVSGNEAAASCIVDENGAVITGRVTPDNFLKVYLLDGSASNMNVDGSTPVVYKYTVPAGKILAVMRVIIYMEDASPFDSILFGGITALTNGVDIAANGVIIENWKNNIDIGTCMFDTPGRANFGKETKTLVGRWTLSKEGGGPIELLAGEIFSFTINDDFDRLNAISCKARRSLVRCII